MTFELHIMTPRVSYGRASSGYLNGFAEHCFTCFSGNTAGLLACAGAIWKTARLLAYQQAIKQRGTLQTHAPRKSAAISFRHRQAAMKLHYLVYPWVAELRLAGLILASGGFLAWWPGAVCRRKATRS
jgi:hypothetical protein